jgi:transglutaminase/protease-like cytokinesis protein 3
MSIVIPESVTRISSGAFTKYLRFNPISQLVTERGETFTRTRSDIVSRRVPNAEFVIHGKAGSFADTWARTNRIAFSDGRTVRIENTFKAVYEHNFRIFKSQPNPAPIEPSGNSAIVNQANAITRGITDDYEKARAIFNWVAENINYDSALSQARGPQGRTQDALVVLETKLAVCTGFTNLTNALFHAVGIPAKRVDGFASSNYPFRTLDVRFKRQGNNPYME